MKDFLKIWAIVAVFLSTLLMAGSVVMITILLAVMVPGPYQGAAVALVVLFWVSLGVALGLWAADKREAKEATAK